MPKDSSAKYYQSHKERIQKKACGRSFLKEEKEKKQQYGRERIRKTQACWV